MRAIVLFLGKISFPVNDISFPLCDISFLVHDKSFPLSKISFQFIVLALRNMFTYTSPNISYDIDDSALLRSQLFQMASGELSFRCFQYELFESQSKALLNLPALVP